MDKKIKDLFRYLFISALLLLGSLAQAEPNSWTSYETDAENYGMGWTNAHWVPVLGKMLLFGGNSHNALGNNSVRLFDPVNDQWEILYANNNGVAGVQNRDNHVSFYVPGRGENGEFWVFRGAIQNQFGGVFSLDTNEWTEIFDTANEFAQLGLIKGIEDYDYTENAASDWCPELNMGVTFGGRNTDRTRFIEPNDDGGLEPYKYWHTVYDNGPDKIRQGQNSGVCIDKEFYLYGGETLTGSGVVRSRALWKLDLMTKTWIQLPDNDLPDGQRIEGSYLVVTYDSGSNVLVVNRGQKFNVYHLDSDTWEYIDAPVDANADWRGSNHAGVYSPLVNQHIYRWSGASIPRGITEGYTYADVGGPVSPIVSLSADPLAVASGGMTTLMWSVSNATSCTASGDWSGNKAASANNSEQVGPLTATSTFELSCTGDGGNTVRSVLISISAGGGVASPTVSLSADPLTVESGGMTTLLWSVSDATSCTASGDWSGSKAASENNSEKVGPLTLASTFELSCTGDGGDTVRSVSISIGGIGGGLNIPVNTWVHREMPGFGNGPARDIKHLRLAHNPVDGRVYFLGGDYGGPGGIQSGRNELYSYSVVDDSWVEEYPYCGEAGSVQPGAPDEVGWVYDTKRNIFWMIPGFMWGEHPVSSHNVCDATYVKNEIMTFDPVTKKWTDPKIPLLSGLGAEANKFAQYDPEEDAIITFYWDGGHGTALAIYHIDSMTWERVKFPKPNDNARINKEYTAMDLENRTIYTMDPKAGRLYAYDMDARTLNLLGNTPVVRNNFGITWMAWDSVNKVVLWYFGGQIWVYHPNTDTWENPNPILPEGTPAVRGNNVGFDPYQNVLLVMGGLPPNPYLFLYRYGNSNVAIPGAPTGLNMQLP